MVLSDNKNIIMKHRQTTPGGPALDESHGLGASEPKRSSMSSIVYPGRDRDRNKVSKSVNFRPSSLINERNQPKHRINYSHDSQTNRVPVLKSSSPSSYYAQAIGGMLLRMNC